MNPTPITDPTTPRILHTWQVTVTREVSETAPEVVNGQTVQVTRKVQKPVETRMALRDLTRQERRGADLFRAKRTAHYVKDHGLLLASELTNRLINTTGGVLTEKEKERVEKLRARHAELDLEIVRAKDDVERQKSLQREQANVRTELLTLNAINEQLYAQTAEAKAESDLSNWVTFHVTLIDRSAGGAATPDWKPYFEGDTFEKREAWLWDLEERKDEFYIAAAQKIASYTFWFNKGADSAEAFKLFDEELARQDQARREVEEEHALAKEEVLIDKLIAEAAAVAEPVAAPPAQPETVPTGAPPTVLVA